MSLLHAEDAWCILVDLISPQATLDQALEIYYEQQWSELALRHSKVKCDSVVPSPKGR